MKSFLDSWGLTLATFLPLVGVAIMLLIPKAEEQLHKIVALATTLAVGVIGVLLLTNFDYDRAGEFQFVINKPWIEFINSRYHMGLDGISLPLIALTILVVPLCIIYSWNHFPEPQNPKAFLILLLILETGMIGSFLAEDLILFFVFFEVVLLPMYFLIGVWGGDQRQYASIKFFLYTLFGSALMIVSFLALYFLSDQVDGLHTFDMTVLPLAARSISSGWALVIFGGMFMGFGIKVPIFPFHTWLPDAHTQAPTVGSVILAAVLLKLGTYGFVRIAVPILPEAARTWAPWIGLLAVIGIVYGALCCLAQTDMKRLIAFSSVAHMGYVMLGISSLTAFGMNAALFGMVAHGLITGMLFFIAGTVKERYHTLEIKRLGGMLTSMPHLGWILGLTTMASLGLPGLAGFWGEFPAILSAWDANVANVGLFRGYMVVAAIGTVLAAGYLLWLYQRAAFGTPPAEFADDPHLHDVTLLEWVAWVPMLVGIVVLGFFPNLIFQVTDPAVITHVMSHVLTAGSERVVLAELTASAWQAPTIDYHAIAPEIVLTGVIVVMILVDLFAPRGAKGLLSSLAGIGLLATAIPLITLAVDGTPRVMFGGAYVVDQFTLVLSAVFVATGYVVVLLSTNTIAEGDYWEGEYYILLLSSVLGMMVMASARDLIGIFIALELLSIPAYMLAAWRKRDLKGNEAGLKYYLMGVFASAVMLYGMSLIYGFTGSTILVEIGARVSGDLGDAKPMVVLAIVFVLVGFGFKVSAVPFHTWAPDTYEGAPTPITAFLATASKAAGFVALLELIFIGFLGRGDVYRPLMWALSAATMTVGNLIALRQTNVVRLLAYSGIAQAGYILAPFAVAGSGVTIDAGALQAIITYLVIYVVMNLGAFAVVIAVARKTRSAELSSFGGLFQYAPGLAVCMTIFLASLAGIPPMGGWFAKFEIWFSLVQADSASGYALAVLVAVNSVIAVFYYFRILREMWMEDAPDGDRTPIRVPASLTIALVLTTSITLVYGVFPGVVAHFTDSVSLVTLGR